MSSLLFRLFYKHKETILFDRGFLSLGETLESACDESPLNGCYINLYLQLQLQLWLLSLLWFVSMYYTSDTLSNYKSENARQ